MIVLVFGLAAVVVFVIGLVSFFPLPFPLPFRKTNSVIGGWCGLTGT